LLLTYVDKYHSFAFTYINGRVNLEVEAKKVVIRTYMYYEELYRN